MSSKYFDYEEIKRRVIEERGISEEAFEDLIEQYKRKYHERFAENKVVLAVCIARDLGVEIKSKKFRTGIHKKIAEIEEDDRGIAIDECYVGGKWESVTTKGDLSVKFLIFDDTGAITAQVTGDRINQLEDVNVGDAVMLENASVTKTKGGDLILNISWSTSRIVKLKPEEVRLPPIESYKREIRFLEDGKFSMIEGIALDCDRRPYLGCPVCKSVLKGKRGEQVTCKKCGRTVTLQEVGWATLIVNDGTGDVMCELAPALTFEDSLLGTLIRVYGVYDSKSDTIDVSHIEPAEVPIEAYIKPAEEAKEVKVEVKPQAKMGEAVPEQVVNDVIAMVKFLPTPLTVETLKRSLEKGDFGDVKISVEELINALLRTGEVKLEGNKLVRKT